ncbi:PAS domain-containing protein [Desulfovibrio sp. TomC]|uniref:PAS domain-containing protein n=1 Tax=Desulfovibrio sp. TomC TaxID=1562888 RepID=UPI000574ED42|nr:PAS domain-containing protein [Desulfovibrio sp. TomC]KHK01936.1 Signal transduction histidine kinase [Desulfovibrio sp. TomC]
MPSRRPQPRHFPTRSVLALLGLGLVLAFGLGWMELAAEHNTAIFPFVIEGVVGELRAAAGELHAMALLAAAGETQAVAASREQAAKIAACVETLRRSAPKTQEFYDFACIDGPLQRVLDIENRAIALAADRGGLAQAQALLQGQDSRTARADLRDCLEQAQAKVRTIVQERLASQDHHARLAAGVIGLGTLALGLFALMLLRRAVRAAQENAAARAALGESDRRFRDTFELAAVGIAHVGLDGQFLRANNRFLEITGYTAEALQAQTFAAITHPEDLDEDLEQVARLLSGAIDTFAMDKRYVRQDGSLVWVSLTVSLLRDAAGAPLHYISVISDISDRKAAEAAAKENAATVTALLDATSDRVFLVDAAGRILAANMAAAQGLDVAREAITGLTFDAIFPPDLARSRLAHLTRALLLDRPVRFTDERSGILFDIIIAPLPAAPGTPGRAALFARDATELIRAREAAEAASQAKSDFLANVSHELRTPLNGIMGMAQLLGTTPLESDQQQCLDDLQSAAAALLALVNDLLDLAKIEAGRMDLVNEPFVLSSIIQGVTATLEPLATNKGLTLVAQVEAEVPRLLVGDGDKLRQVLLNLVGNGLKFTETGGVTLDVACARPSVLPGCEGTVTDVFFAVRDSGIGIAAADQARIFESFTQVDTSATRRFGGTGLGLAISQRLVTLMGGGIGVQSEPGKGSVFSFAVRFAVRDDALLGDGLRDEPATAPDRPS